MLAWNGWYHCTAHTYGTWLRGDPRGWRARHHREHVDGDYRNPPPRGTYASLHAYSKSLMKRAPVRVNRREVIAFVLQSLIDRLREQSVSVSIASFDGVHSHVLAQCDPLHPRIAIGIAKQYATAQLQAHGSAVGRGLKRGDSFWGKGSHPEPIRNGAHYNRTFVYIRDHSDRGAVVIVPPPLVMPNSMQDFDPKSLLID